MYMLHPLLEALAPYSPAFLYMGKAITYYRVVSQIEYPSLVDLRGLLLDLVAQLLGALSRIR